MVNEASAIALGVPAGQGAVAAGRRRADLHEVRPAVLDRGRDPEHADRGGGASARVQLARRSSVRQVRRSEARLTLRQRRKLDAGGHPR